jgi:hypothetical protein
MLFRIPPLGHSFCILVWISETQSERVCVCADCHHEARAWRIVHSNWLPLSSLKNDRTEKLKILHLMLLPEPTSASPGLVWKPPCRYYVSRPLAFGSILQCKKYMHVYYLRAIKQIITIKTN